MIRVNSIETFETNITPINFKRKYKTYDKFCHDYPTVGIPAMTIGLYLVSDMTLTSATY